MYHQHEFYDKRGGGDNYAGQSSEYEYDDDYDHELNGLLGLQNIANTCYMNSALQALSNSPPLTRYFLDCGNIVEATCNLPNNLIRTKPGIAKNYHRFIRDMWSSKRRHNGYIVPNGILQGIRIVHPMFRGFQQHDTQEFLRCFMDQLHEELKEITPPPPNFDVPLTPEDENAEDFSPCPSPSPSQSEAEYETCDSGVSDRSSYSDDVSMASTSNLKSSPSPSQRTINYTSLNRTSSATSLSSQTNQKVKDSGSSQQQQKHHRSIISDIFDGKLLSSVQCLTCDRVSTREETFQDLSLPIPGKDHLAVLHQTQGIGSQVSGVTCTDAVYQATQDGWIWWFWNWFRSWFWGPAVSLYDCMGAFFSADELKGDNMYSCEKCNKLRNGVKFSRVLALPEMLCVHLKRFRHDLSYSSKISSPVHFPLTGLDMRPYLHKGEFCYYNL
jgi:ubiquitin carboxyl-terminal hydrolase 20/33